MKTGLCSLPGYKITVVDPVRWLASVPHRTQPLRYGVATTLVITGESVK